jgi:predicted enzyme related to lactoylglutathione lyase
MSKRRPVSAQRLVDAPMNPIHEELDTMAVLQADTLYIDCADPAALADFYQKATGWEITSSGADSASLGGGPIAVGFQRVDGYRPPSWPDTPAHLHLDFTVADTAAAVDELIALGATKPDFQPGEWDWVVLLDPEGHPFCVSS